MYGLPQKVYEQICDIIKGYNDSVTFKIFGSRARGDFKYNSDIDIVVISEVDDDTMFDIKNKFDLLDIIYMIDLVFLQNITNDKFKNNILEEGRDIKDA